MSFLSLPELPVSLPADIIEQLHQRFGGKTPVTWMRRNAVVANCMPLGFGCPVDSEPLVAQAGDICLTHPAKLTLTVVPVSSDMSFIGYFQDEFRLQIKRLGTEANGYVTVWETIERGFVNLGVESLMDATQPLFRLSHSADGAVLEHHAIAGQSVPANRRWRASTWDCYGSNVLESESGDVDVVVSTSPLRIPDSDRRKALVIIDQNVMSVAGATLQRLGLSHLGSFEGIIV